MNQNQIFYFKHINRWVAVAPGQFEESITYCERGFNELPLYARIEFTSGVACMGNSFYERIENGYSPCSRQEFLEYRYKVQAATAEFFGEFQQFQPSLSDIDYDLMQGFLAR